MRYFLGLFIVLTLISITALIFADSKWELEPGASYTIESEPSNVKIKIISAGEDRESASLNCVAEGAIRVLKKKYNNVSCKPCKDGEIPEKTFQVKYPSDIEEPKLSEHKIGGKTIYFAQCFVDHAIGTLSCSSCQE